VRDSVVITSFAENPIMRHLLTVDGIEEIHDLIVPSFLAGGAGATPSGVGFSNQTLLPVKLQLTV
jgi:hypothetical protein